MASSCISRTHKGHIHTFPSPLTKCLNILILFKLIVHLKQHHSNDSRDPGQSTLFKPHIYYFMIYDYIIKHHFKEIIESHQSPLLTIFLKPFLNHVFILLCDKCLWLYPHYILVNVVSLKKILITKNIVFYFTRGHAIDISSAHIAFKVCTLFLPRIFWMWLGPGTEINNIVGMGITKQIFSVPSLPGNLRKSEISLARVGLW